LESVVLPGYRLISGEYAKFSVYAYDQEDEGNRRALGKLLTHRIGQIIEELGYRTEIPRGQSNGVDIRVWNKDSIVLVAEIKNYNIKTKLTYDRKEDFINNLLEYPNCKKFLIYTQMANEEILDDLGDWEISALKIGYQLLPAWFYYSLEIEHRYYRLIDSKETSLDIKNKLSRIIQPIAAEIPMQLL
jgi:hypothetical protein